MKLLDSLLTQLELFRSKVRINPYLFAIIVLVLGFAGELVLNIFLHQIAYLLLVISLFLAAWYGGFWPCLLITIVGFLVADYYFISPRYSFFANTTEYIRGLVFLLEGILFGLAGEARLKRDKEVTRAYQAEQKARKSAEDANNMRDDFISMASHELKSPITSQKMYVQSLEKRMKTNNDAQSMHFLNMINSQTDSMIRLINDLLNVAKIRAGKMSMNYSTFSLADLVVQIAEEVQTTDTTHTISLKGKSTHKVHADREKIAEVITNLLSNAIKYSPRAQKVDIILSEDNKQVVVGIRDFGIGISRENQKKIFTKYFRATGISEKTYKGFGMGLYIVSEIIKQHKGKIWVKSTQGKGSTFSFSLPLAK